MGESIVKSSRILLSSLKLIITSATIDVQRFSEHFSDRKGIPAPIITVEGRTYPVDITYLPPDEIPGKPDEVSAQIEQALTYLLETEKASSVRGGDVLVFLSGERDILETAHHLRKQKDFNSLLQQCDIVPLYARLTLKEQQKIFAPHTGRRIVLSTNVAETSLTVPGIRYVIDVGNARISRYNHRSRVQRLPIENISQASANQRAGRCGRWRVPPHPRSSSPSPRPRRAPGRPRWRPRWRASAR